MRTVDLYFYGYTWEEYAFHIPNLTGIYRGSLAPEGSIIIKDLLYVGYHKSIKELYDDHIMDSIRQYVNPIDQIFLSYAEVPFEEDGKDLASVILNETHPKYSIENNSVASDIKLVCKGNSKLIPEVIIG